MGRSNRIDAAPCLSIRGTIIFVLDTFICAMSFFSVAKTARRVRPRACGSFFRQPRTHQAWQIPCRHRAGLFKGSENLSNFFGYLTPRSVST